MPTRASKVLAQASSRALTLLPVALVIVGLVVVLLLAVGVRPSDAGVALWRASFGTPRSFGEVLVRATPLLLVAICLIPSLRAGLYNIGAPGQLSAGALVSTLIALHAPGLSGPLLVSACALGGLLGGAALAFIPGLLKARWNANEIISTLAFNFIMLSVLGYLLNGPMQSNFANLPQSDSLPTNSSLPIVISGTRAHIGLVIALASAVMLWAVDRSRVGYRLRIFGANPALARQARVKPGRYIVWLMVVGGAGAGLAGWMQVAAVDGRLYPSVADPVGYAGFFVALLGGLTPFGTVIAALLMGILLHGGDALQVGAGVSPEIVQVLLGLILFGYAARAGKADELQDVKGAGGRWSFLKRS